MVYHQLTTLSVVIRIMVSILIGGLIGLERSTKNRPAGLRTYMLVCVGACLIMLTNQFVFQTTGTGDAMRLGAQVVSGIGFLGAGTIVVTKHNQIKGLTTAAGLWAAGGVGLAVGVGFYAGAIAATVGIYTILAVLQRWERRSHKKVRILEIYVELLNTTPVSKLTQAIRKMDLTIESIQFDSDGWLESNTRGVVLCLKSRKWEDYLQLREKLRKIDGIMHLEVL